MPLACLHAPFDHPDWIFEPLLDGFRALVYVEDGRAQPGSVPPETAARRNQVITVEGIEMCRGVVADAGKKPKTPGDCTANLEVVDGNWTGNRAAICA